MSTQRPTSLAPDWASLSRGEVHIWVTYPEAIQSQSLLARYEALLTEDERERHLRYMFARHRHDFLVTRALVRSVLSRYEPMAPEDWRFESNEHGRPELAAGMPGAGRIRFNISHTDNLIVCMLNAHIDAGIDVEHDQRVKDPMQLADHFFSPIEAASLRSLTTSDAQRTRFFSYWTLKEALIKAKGMGLALPLHQFSFLLEEESRIGIQFHEHPAVREEKAENWQFVQWEVSTHHKMALAARLTHECRPLVCRCAVVTPLLDAIETIRYPVLGCSHHSIPN